MHRIALLSAAFGLIFLGGCGRKRKLPDPAPRPVSTVRLAAFAPSAPELVSGVVGSWKVENIGFEVSGRVDYMIEPESLVEGYLTANSSDKSLGGVVASIDADRYRSQLASAKSQVEKLRRQLDALEIEHGRVLPARKSAAVAAEKLAQIEYDRTEGLLRRNAVPKAKFDEVDAALKQAKADLDQADANIESKGAEIESLKADITQALEAVKDAQRDVDDCTLRAPFRGQIAEVHVIPGAFVQRGEPVVTLQMMNPIKIEFEVSAKRARSLRYKDEISVSILKPDGNEMVTRNGIVYQTGTVADPGTRTFTITVLIRNELRSTFEDVSRDNRPNVAFTRDTWPLIKEIIGEPGSLYFEKDAIKQDDQGSYIYRIASPPRGQQTLGRVLEVEKARIVAEREVVSFLGLWDFQRVSLPQDSTLDVENDRFVGKITFADGDGQWDGKSVVFQRDRWLLRPGDLIRVDLGNQGFASGFYAPLSAIHEDRGKFYVFVVDKDADAGVGLGRARRVEVSILDGPNTLRRIEEVRDDVSKEGASGESGMAEGRNENGEGQREPQLKEGDRIVDGGVHFIVDGEQVKDVGAVR